MQFILSLRASQIDIFSEMAAILKAPSGKGGDSYMKGAGMLVRNF